MTRPELDAGRVFALGAAVAILGCVAAVLLTRDALPPELDVIPAGAGGFAAVAAAAGAVIEARLGGRALSTATLAVLAIALAPLMAVFAAAAVIIVAVVALGLVLVFFGAL